MKFLLITAFLGVFVWQVTQAKTFDECSLAVEMSRLGVPHSELPDWICIAQHESSFKTTAMNSNTNKSKDWGLFQINDKYWCDPKNGRKTYNICKISCTDLLSDDITAAVHCARTVKSQQGYKAWVAWNNHCQKSKPSVSHCF